MKKDFLVLVHPNMNILDKWLPVLWELAAQNIGCRFTAVFFRDRYVATARETSVRTNIADTLFERCCWIAPKQGVYFSKSLRTIPSEVALRQEIVAKLHLKGKARKGLQWLLELVSPMMFRLLYGRGADVRELLGTQYDGVFTDVAILADPEVNDFLLRLRPTAVYCLPHGADHHVGSISRDRQLSHSEILNSHDLRVFTENKNFTEKLSAKFCIPVDKIVPVGLPHLDKNWSAVLLQFTPPNMCEDAYVLITSRPATQGLLDKSEKFEIVAKVCQLAMANDLRVLVRPHPKEPLQDLRELLAAAAGSSFANQVSVDQSASRSTILDAEMVINMSTSMPEEIAYVGAASIVCRYADSRAHWNWPYRNDRGVRLCEAEHQGYALSASSNEELETAFNYSLQNKKKVADIQQENYRRKATPLKGAAAAIVAEIRQASVS